MNRTFVDIHVLQTVPPSNLNRDDTGSPKTATYGGAQRARVSSQAWKRATRKAFDGLLDTSELGVRSKRVVEIIAKAIRDKQPGVTDEQALKAAREVLESAGIKTTEPRGKKGAIEESGYLIFLSNQQISALAALAAAALETGEKVDKKVAQALLKDKNSIDLALFGRMVAEVTDLNVDASCQVAHALSTHAVETEFDYFTAVDDQKAATADEDAGAGMIGTIEFNSATLYRYATIDVDLLAGNLGSIPATERAVRAFIEAFVRSMPTGKQNTFANRTLPDAVIITVRSDQPVSYVGAFETPVRRSAQGDGYVAGSAKQFADYGQEIAKAYGAQTVLETWVVAMGRATEPLKQIGAEVSLAEAVANVSQLVTERLKDNGEAESA